MDMVDLVKGYDVVAIDEGQFFDDLHQFILAMEQMYHIVDDDDDIGGKKKKPSVVIISALSGDSNRQCWPNMNAIYPLVDDIMHCKAFCVDCNDGTLAAFSKCVVVKTGQTLIGDKEAYKATCRRHFLK